MLGDAFVTKVSGAGALLWSSYLGGASIDDGAASRSTAAGNAFVTGQTKSLDFPTSGGFDTTLGGSDDAFVTKISGAGVLLWSSYLGGSNYEEGRGIAVDGGGNARAPRADILDGLPERAAASTDVRRCSGRVRHESLPSCAGRELREG